jgi:hypothetical protein
MILIPNVQLKSMVVFACRKRGRPSDYNPNKHPSIALFLCTQYGATNEHLAQSLGIPLGTFDNWLEAHDEFRAAIKEGKENWNNGRVENTLLRRAMGYGYVETRIKEVLVDGFDVDGCAVAVPALFRFH